MTPVTKWGCVGPCCTSWHVLENLNEIIIDNCEGIFESKSRKSQSRFSIGKKDNTIYDGRSPQV